MFLSLQTMYVVCTHIHGQFEGIQDVSYEAMKKVMEMFGASVHKNPFEREHNNISGFPYINHVLVHRFMSLQAMCVFAHIFLDNVASRQFEGVQKMSFMKQ